MKYPLIAFTALLITVLTSCGGNTPADQPVADANTPKKNETFEQRVRRDIEAKLKIPATEKYALRIYKGYIDADTVQDAVITINRMEFAMDEAIKQGRTAKAAEMGYLGNYNFFFYYDGSIDMISDPVTVPSSPGRELDVTFRSITSPTKKDVIIDYRIRNSGWRSYFTSSGEGRLTLMFQWKWFDYIGEEKAEALNHVLEDSPEGVMKDISIYESAIDNYSKDVKDVYKYEPVITKKGALVYRFFFDPRVGKYRLYSPKMLNDLGLTAVGDAYRSPSQGEGAVKGN
jgi:hypothetical protein